MKITLEQLLTMSKEELLNMTEKTEAQKKEGSVSEAIHEEMKALKEKYNLGVAAIVFTRNEQLTVVASKDIAKHEMIGLLECAKETVRRN